ncbi:MAG: polysaccharide deacetylase family protein [Halanaerobiales bacterium]
MNYKIIFILVIIALIVISIFLPTAKSPEKDEKEEINQSKDEYSSEENQQEEYQQHEIEKPERELKDLREIMDKQAELYPDTFFIKGPESTKRIALTFDDGPEENNTPAILDILAEKDVRATFFLLGEHIELFPEIVNRIKNEGHQLGNHSWSHPNFREKDSNTVIEKEIKKTSRKIENITGVYPKLLRPPFGAILDQTIETLKKDNWKIVNWSIDSLDWNTPRNNHHKIIQKVQKLHHPGGIILMHNNMNSQSTVDALPALIDTLREKGYEFNTIDELLFRR